MHENARRSSLWFSRRKQMELSEYHSSDIEEIEDLFLKVFSDSEGQSEGLLIGKLVRDLMNDTARGDLYGFIAKENGQIVGSIFFSRFTLETEVNAFILSPVAVHTDYQGQGIGQKLINYGIEYLKENGVDLVFTYGDPDFYGKVGFGSISEKIVKAPFKLKYPFGWLGQSLDGNQIEPIAGKTYCVDALNHPEYW
jgi:predicted N-acetyltransferase YhbS